jgi:hypothetical protein
MQPHFKDAILNDLADRANVAQFVSFGPDRQQRYARVHGFEPNHRFSAVERAIEALLGQAPERSINVRSFLPDQPQGQEFLYGLTSAADAISAINRLTAGGLFAIANETVDVNDGGVSGVVHGSVMEFAPGGTPRVVESGRIVSITRDLGYQILHTVYGFEFDLNLPACTRIEFSLHPIRRGYRSEHMIIWETQESALVPVSPLLMWPNKFSEMLGDKAFGLVVAASLGLRVPRTTVISRSLRPFTFGSETGSDVVWLRTCPAIPEPGLFPTVRGWTDPFALLQQVNDSARISSVLIQQEVPPHYSGAVLTSSTGEVIIEGVAGFGDDFMLGRAHPMELPIAVTDDVKRVHAALISQIGSARAEWAYDGSGLWILQVQPEPAMSAGMTIVPGHPSREVDFDVAGGLSGLRELVNLLRDRNVGINLRGQIGVTSHIADVLRRYRIPSRIVPA